MINRNLEIDRLRAIAILLIACGHYALVYFPWAVSNKLEFLGGAVDVFFVISGYVISCSIVSKIDLLRSETNRLSILIKGFYLRRIWRIYPASWLVFFFVLLCTYIFTNSSFGTPGNTLQAGVYLFTTIFSYLFMNHYDSMALGPYWALNLEEQFYFLFPIFLLFTNDNKERFKILLFILLVINFISRPLSLYLIPDGVFFSHNRLDAFIYGFMIYYFMQQPWIQYIKITPGAHKYLRPVIIIAAFALLLGISLTSIPSALIISLGMLLAFFIVLSAAFESDVIVFPFGIQKILDIIGGRAYSLYLVHMPMILFGKELYTYLISKGITLPIGASVLAATLIIITTELLQRLVVTPTMQIGRTVSKQMLDDYDTQIATASR